MAEPPDDPVSFTPALPLVVIAGRPNVGKSTLFNKLAGRRAALVSDIPGVTRDRKDAEAILRGRAVRLMDTAGLEESAPDSLYGRMRASSESAVGMAGRVLFGIDEVKRDHELKALRPVIASGRRTVRGTDDDLRLIGGPGKEVVRERRAR